VSFRFFQRRLAVIAPRLRSHGDHSAARRADLAELTPGVLPFLGMAARLQLFAFEQLSAVATLAPDLHAKAVVASAAGAALTRHEGLTDQIRHRDDDPVDAMDPYSDAVRDFANRIAGADWREDLLASYVVFGLLDDFFLRLAGGLPIAFAERTTRLLHEAESESAVASLLKQEIEANPRLSDPLALWGRRLVGDTLLMARSVLRQGAEGDEEVEPIFSEVVAAHTRRMDRLGLTA
jgi:hypothetical protein